MAVKMMHGNIFASSMQSIVIPVNVVGAMGKGLARQCRDLYPDAFENYLKHYRYHKDSLITIGTHIERHIRSVRACPVSDGRQMVFFPTKKHWKEQSNLDWIEDNLYTLTDHYQEMGITSLAFPPLGCGEGGLSVDVVVPLICRFAKRMEIPVEVYR